MKIPFNVETTSYATKSKDNNLFYLAYVRGQLHNAFVSRGWISIFDILSHIGCNPIGCLKDYEGPYVIQHGDTSKLIFDFVEEGDNIIVEFSLHE